MSKSFDIERLSRLVLFVTSTVIGRLSSFFLILIVSRSCSAADLSAFGLILNAMTIVQPIVSLNSTTVISRFFYDFPEDQRISLVGTLLKYSMISTFIFLIITAPVLMYFLPTYAKIIVISCVVVLLRCQSANYISLSKCDKGSMSYLGISLVDVFPLLLILLISTIGNLSDAITMLSLSVAISFSIGTLLNKRFWKSSISNSFNQIFLRFSIPLIPTALFGWLLWNCARWNGAFLLDLESLANYTILMTLFNALQLVFRAIFDAALANVGIAASKQDVSGVKHILGHAQIHCALIGTAFVLGMLCLQVTGSLSIIFGREIPLHMIGLLGALSILDIAYCRQINFLMAFKLSKHAFSASLAAIVITVLVSTPLVYFLHYSGLMVATVFAPLVQVLAFTHATRLIRGHIPLEIS